VTQPESAGGIADVMAGMPEVWRRLLAAHLPDRLGRCRSCRTASGSGERWPCSLHQIATEAQRLHGLRLGQAVAGD
jgi:hypothetical protein